MFVKHAWLTFYYGLARSRTQRYFIHFMQFTAAAFGISSVLVVVLQCIPLRYVWQKDLAPPVEDSAQCINLVAFFYANAIIMIVNDVVMYLIPMFLLRDVDMLKPYRWGIYALFGIGGLYVHTSPCTGPHTSPCSQPLADRLPESSWRASCVSSPSTNWANPAMFPVSTDHPALVLNPTMNLTSNEENYALVLLWAAVENHVGICAACAGALKQKSMSTFESVRRSYDHLRNKSWTPPSTLRTQDTEERRLYERSDSTAPQLSLSEGLGPKDTEVQMELFQVTLADEVAGRRT